MRGESLAFDHNQMIPHAIVILSFDEGEGSIIETHKTFALDTDMLNEFKGDEKATVRVAMELSDKKFGAGVSISGAVTLTVGQDDTMIETAFNYGAALLGEKIREVTPQVNAIYEELRQR